MGTTRQTPRALACSAAACKGSKSASALEHVFGPGALHIDWVPGGRLYVCERPSYFSAASYDKVVTLPIGSQPDHFLVESSSASMVYGTQSRNFSPSGDFRVGRGPGGLCLIDLESGQKRWDATRDPGWAAQTKLGRIRALQGEPLGTGLGSRLDFCDWSPTGASFVCHIDIDPGKWLRPSMLRMYWMA